jgi:NitT/TauT family transport system substrate-binding protein
MYPKLFRTFAAAALLFATSAQAQPVIHVGVGIFEAHADAYYAQDLGYFKRLGLNVEIQQFDHTSAIVAAIVGGSLQVGAGSPIPMANAHQHGLDITIIAPGGLYDRALPQVSGLVVAADSPIKTGKDLSGKLVGVSSLGSIDQIAVERWIDTNGGDSQTVKFVELQNGVMPEAVSTGRVAAAYAADPVYTSGLQDGKVRLLAHAFESIARRYMIVGWFSTKSWADANPDAARKFAQAINEGSAWAVKNPEAAMTVLGKYMKVTSVRAHEYHARSLEPGLLQPLLDAAVHYKAIAQPLDARDLLWSPRT